MFYFVAHKHLLLAYALDQDVTHCTCISVCNLVAELL